MPCTVFSEYLACVGSSLRTDGAPEISLRASHHESEVIWRLALRLRPRPRYAGNAAVLNAAAPTFFDLHLQLQIKVTCLFAAKDDVVVSFRFAFEGLTYHDAIFDTPYGVVGIPS